MTTPDYATNDPRGWCGDPQRGAALGRPTVHAGAPAGKMTLRRVRLNGGGYDRNGTYFGHGAPLYWYADEGGNVDAMLRASSREIAKDKIRALFPLTRFYR
jgi:hypothetical protein